MKKIIKTKKGVIISDKMNKTRVVKVERLVMHPKYKKYVRIRKKFKAHDEQNESRIGDKVIISETRPFSKEKRWKISQIIEHSNTVEVKVPTI